MLMKSVCLSFCIITHVTQISMQFINVVYISMFSSENEVYSIYRSFSETFKRITLHYSLCGKIVCNEFYDVIFFQTYWNRYTPQRFITVEYDMH